MSSGISNDPDSNFQGHAIFRHHTLKTTTLYTTITDQCYDGSQQQQFNGLQDNLGKLDIGSISNDRERVFATNFPDMQCNMTLSVSVYSNQCISGTASVFRSDQ